MSQAYDYVSGTLRRSGEPACLRQPGVRRSRPHALSEEFAMAKKDKLAARMSSLMAMETACHLTRDDVSRLVVKFVRDQGFPAATEASNFSTDVPVDSVTRRGWAVPIRKRIITAGCDPKGFGPADCEQAGKVKTIVDALARALK